VGPNSGVDGIDQIVVALPSSLAGVGAVALAVTIQGRAVNTVAVNIG
jgi:hypothetical protein